MRSCDLCYLIAVVRRKAYNDLNLDSVILPAAKHVNDTIRWSYWEIVRLALICQGICAVLLGAIVDREFLAIAFRLWVSFLDCRRSSYKIPRESGFGHALNFVLWPDRHSDVSCFLVFIRANRIGTFN